MSVEPTTDHPGIPSEPVGDFRFAFRCAMSVEEAEKLFRCDGDFRWGEEQDLHLNWLCETLEYTLASNPADTYERDVNTGRTGHWRQLREIWGYTVETAGEQVGVSAATISRYETGERKPHTTAYRSWLRKLWGQDVAYWRTHIFLECMIRDAWHPDEWQGGNMTPIWDAFWNEGGYFDQWKKTGVLPDTNPTGEPFDGIMELRGDKVA